MKTKKIPFNIERAKAGAKVVTRDGYPVRIVDCTVKDENRPLLGLVLIDGKEHPVMFSEDGKRLQNTESAYDLFIEAEVKCRRMTNQELAWWLHDHPEEHREMTYSNEDNYVSSDLSYLKSEANIQVYEKIVIRKNGGAWQEPLIEE